jgi:hypothetical protein
MLGTSPTALTYLLLRSSCHSHHRQARYWPHLRRVIVAGAHLPVEIRAMTATPARTPLPALAAPRLSSRQWPGEWEPTGLEVGDSAAQTPFSGYDVDFDAEC